MKVPFYCFLTSLLLYSFAPQTYSFLYCVIVLAVYIASSIWVINRFRFRENYFTFNTLFLLSFFFVNFLYPVFIFPIDPEYFPVYKLSFNFDVITQATSLALVGSCSYILGISALAKKEVRPSVVGTSKINYIIEVLDKGLVILFSLILLFGGVNLFRLTFGATFAIPPGILILFQIVLCLILILHFYRFRGSKTVKPIVKHFNRVSSIIVILFCFTFTFTGDRGPVIQIILTLVCLYSVYIKPIRLKLLLVLVTTGMFALTFISYARTDDVTAKTGLTGFINRGFENTQINSFFDIGMDLIVNNRNLYVGYEYVNQYGISYGTGIITAVFAPFPFLPTLISELAFSKKPSELATSTIITEQAGATYGLGTNLIADLYMNFGTVGVIFFMFLLGYLIRIFSRGSNINYIISYIFMVSFAIYLPRTSLFDPVRYIVWALLIYKVLFIVTLKRIQNKRIKQ